MGFLGRGKLAISSQARRSGGALRCILLSPGGLFCYVIETAAKAGGGYANHPDSQKLHEQGLRVIDCSTEEGSTPLTPRPSTGPVMCGRARTRESQRVDGRGSVSNVDYRDRVHRRFTVHSGVLIINFSSRSSSSGA